MQGTVKEAIEELFHWQHSSKPDWFTARLYDLISHADSFNRQRLSIAFPAEVLAWSMWHEAPDGEEFFKEHGYGK